jgi:sterol desaturase/sphingolipid hydroxylase (fatty acid hydroxylase superfamily)
MVTRGFTYIPIYCLGFSETAIFVYVFLVAIQATFIHANVRWEFKSVQSWIATPAFHHWHHGAEPEAIDKNFSVHTPIWDRIFGTYYMPGRWPKAYGLAGDHKLPSNWLTQLIYPFMKK